jgi:hypothetical protein
MAENKRNREFNTFVNILGYISHETNTVIWNLKAQL